MKAVYLVGCVAKKCSSERPAEELYCSVLFRKAREYVLRKMNAADEWYILSAKHGLLTPGIKVGPYDETLKNAPKPARLKWAGLVINELRKRIQTGDTVVFLAGKRYREFLEPEVLALGCQILVPMRNKRIGQQLEFLGTSGRDGTAHRPGARRTEDLAAPLKVS